MKKLELQELLNLETYAAGREQFRARAVSHKRNRTVHIGPNVTLLFEDKLTIQYQVQEMLRAERIFEPAGIQDELDAYNPLIPDGNNWKATMLIEYPDVTERRKALSRLIDIEDKTWVQVEGCERVYAVADEDLERETAEKTSAVHFLSFELDHHMIAALRKGNTLTAGVAHPEYQYQIEITGKIREALLKDLD